MVLLPMIQQIEISPGLLVVFYDHGEEKFVEIASNYNLQFAPREQRHVGNVFMPLAKFIEILESAELRKMASEL